MRLRDNIRGFLITPARFVRAIEYMLSTATMTWGVILAHPADVFHAAAAWATLRESPLSEAGWGALFVALGLIKLLAVWYRWQRVRRWGAFVAMAVWCGVGLSFFLINPSSPGWSVYVTLFAGLNALTFLRLSLLREAP
jgi:hypothetical protein